MSKIALLKSNHGLIKYPDIILIPSIILENKRSPHCIVGYSNFAVHWLNFLYQDNGTTVYIFEFILHCLSLILADVLCNYGTKLTCYAQNT